MTEGSRRQPRRISKIIATTVDLPLVPATATVRRSSTKRASSSERCSTGTPSRRAAATSGTLSSTALETMRPSHAGNAAPAAGGIRPATGASALPSCGAITTPSASSRSRISPLSPASNARSLPLATPPPRTWYCARALMPLPATPAKW